MRKDVREFIRRLEAVGLTVEATPGHYRVLRDGKPLRKAERFIEEVRGDDLDLASYLRIEERELEAGELN